MSDKSSKKWVLVVDDEPEILGMIRSFLELSFGTDVKFIEAGDGAEATSKLAFQAFDLIITDLKMPKKEGAAFIKSVRESTMNANVPIIVVSGYPDYSLEEEVPYIQIFEKPVDLPTLVDTVSNHFKLGRDTDSRVAADLFNAVIQSCEDFFVQALKESPGRDEPKARRSREDIEGDLLQSFSIKVGNTVNEFIIGFDKSSLQEVREALGVKEEVSPEKFCSKAGKTIIKYAIDYLGNMASNVSVVESKVIPKDSQAYKEFMKKCGIVIPLKSAQGNSFAVQALWEKRS